MLNYEKMKILQRRGQALLNSTHLVCMEFQALDVFFNAGSFESTESIEIQLR